MIIDWFPCTCLSCNWCALTLFVPSSKFLLFAYQLHAFCGFLLNVLLSFQNIWKFREFLWQWSQIRIVLLNPWFWNYFHGYSQSWTQLGQISFFHDQRLENNKGHWQITTDVNDSFANRISIKQIFLVNYYIWLGF